MTIATTVGATSKTQDNIQIWVKVAILETSLVRVRNNLAILAEVVRRDALKVATYA